MIEVGSRVRLPTDEKGRQRFAVVVEIESDVAWCKGYGNGGTAEGPYPLSDIELIEPGEANQIQF